MSRYDIVVYGATGFTGAYIVESMVNSKLFEGVSFAVAGRSEQKLRKTLSDISDKTGKNIRATPLIVADTADEESLKKMASQAKIIINAVGPYRLHGEAVVRAAVENGASHVDISGEPAFIEKMQQKYAASAKEKGVFVVGACGWDSIPCDLGMHFLKRNFQGDLNHAETFVQTKFGPAGYSFNAGTYQTLILGISQAATDGLGKVRREIMPTRIVKGTVRPPKRGYIWKVEDDTVTPGWALPFPGADRSIVNRSEYYDCVEKHHRPAYAETYILVSSLFWAVMLAVWVSVFALMVQLKPSRRVLQMFPDQCSFGLFKNSGPTEEQVAEASFDYWFIGTGYSKQLPLEEQHQEQPDLKVVARCQGPDAGYVSTSGCVLSSALAILKDRKEMPESGGVYTSASAFGETKIYDYLKSFGITYKIEKRSNI